MQYLTEAISKEEVDSWKPGDTVVINSPTGSGKTTFILSALLPRAIRAGKHILYLCNRKILNEQVIVDSRRKLSEFFGETEELTAEQLRAIHIITYQHCEKNYQFPNINKEKEQFHLFEEDIMYYVYDEAHYFLNDAQFNPGTNYWLEKIPTKEINVFMSATPEPLEWFLAFSKLNLKSFNYQYHFKLILSQYRKQAEKRKELTDDKTGLKLYADITHQGSESRSCVKLVENYTTQYINKKCQEIKIFPETFDAVKYHINQGKNAYKTLPAPAIQSCYKQLNVFYYREMKEISKEIQAHPADEKWLVFTDDENAGYKLDAYMEEREIDSAFLSRDTIGKTGRPKKEFKNVVEKQKFGCRVLISTSIMDCGVSIHDPAVKHIVIAHSNKVNFLQMLGRKRLDKDEQVNLYIMLETERRIHGIRHQLEMQMKNLCRLGLVEDFTGELTDTWDLKAKYTLSKVELDLAENVFHSDAGERLIYPYWTGTYRPKKTFMHDYQISKTAFLSTLFDLSGYIEALNEFHDNSSDPYFYLKRQLSWLGKEYDEHRWLHYGKAQKAIADFFNRYYTAGASSKERIWIRKDAQDEFAYECFTLLLSLPELPASLKRYGDRFGKPKRAPGKKLLNKALTALCLPFEVSSKSRTVSKGVRETCWYVEKIS